MKLPILLILCLSFCGGVFAQKTGTMTIKVYFHNEKLNPEMEDCNKAFPTTRKIPKTSAPARAALDELLKGVTAQEKAKGFWSFEPETTAGVLKGVRVSKGAAYVNFTTLAP